MLNIKFLNNTCIKQRVPVNELNSISLNYRNKTEYCFQPPL